jgi:hypothetical protein
MPGVGAGDGGGNGDGAPQTRLAKSSRSGGGRARGEQINSKKCKNVQEQTMPKSTKRSLFI